MSGVWCWEYENGTWKRGGSQEEEPVMCPAAATYPKVKISDRYTGRHLRTNIERLQLALPEDQSPKK